MVYVPYGTLLHVISPSLVSPVPSPVVLETPFTYSESPLMPFTAFNVNLMLGSLTIVSSLPSPLAKVFNHFLRETVPVFGVSTDLIVVLSILLPLVTFVTRVSPPLSISSKEWVSPSTLKPFGDLVSLTKYLPIVKFPNEPA